MKYTNFVSLLVLVSISLHIIVVSALSNCFDNFSGDYCLSTTGVYPDFAAGRSNYESLQAIFATLPNLNVYYFNVTIQDNININPLTSSFLIVTKYSPVFDGPVYTNTNMQNITDNKIVLNNQYIDIYSVHSINITITLNGIMVVSQQLSKLPLIGQTYVISYTAGLPLLVQLKSPIFEIIYQEMNTNQSVILPSSTIQVYPPQSDSDRLFALYVSTDKDFNLLNNIKNFNNSNQGTITAIKRWNWYENPLVDIPYTNFSISDDNSFVWQGQIKSVSIHAEQHGINNGPHQVSIFGNWNFNPNSIDPGYTLSPMLIWDSSEKILPAVIPTNTSVFTFELTTYDDLPDETFIHFGLIYTSTGVLGTYGMVNQNFQFPYKNYNKNDSSNNNNNQNIIIIASCVGAGVIVSGIISYLCYRKRKATQETQPLLIQH